MGSFDICAVHTLFHVYEPFITPIIAATVNTPSMGKNIFVGTHLVRQFFLTEVFQLSQDGPLLHQGATHAPQDPMEVMLTHSTKDQWNLVADHGYQQWEDWPVHMHTYNYTL